MTELITFTSASSVVQKNPWRAVGLIAERLGVKPASKNVSGSLLVSGAEYIPVYGGQPDPVYDINDIAVALLNRLDEIEKSIPARHD